MTIENNERTEASEPIPAPGPDPGDFEVWLDRQQDRDDYTGVVARWIIRNLIEGEWLSTTSLWIAWKRDHESRWRYWRAYLQREHNVYTNMDLFEAAFAEYIEADERYREWWANEFIRQQKQGAFWPDVPGDDEAREESGRFWDRVEREQEDRKQPSG